MGGRGEYGGLYGGRQCANVRRHRLMMTVDASVESTPTFSYTDTGPSGSSGPDGRPTVRPYHRPVIGSEAMRLSRARRVLDPATSPSDAIVTRPPRARPRHVAVWPAARSTGIFVAFNGRQADFDSVLSSRQSRRNQSLFLFNPPTIIMSENEAIVVEQPAVEEPSEAAAEDAPVIKDPVPEGKADPEAEEAGQEEGAAPSEEASPE
uniref:Uncharacterized protein n=1 Tax=Plectus sambesii TaxID=2011161 RepID=A0A914XK25_9BILA